MKLYEITEAIQRWAFELEQGNGDIPDEAAMKTLAELQIPFDEKVSNIGRLIKNKRAMVGALKYEMATLKNRCESEEKDIARLERYAGLCIGEGVKYVSPDAIISFGWRQSQAVEVNEELLSQEYWRVPEPKPVPNKELLTALLKDGKEVPGAQLVKRWNLQVK